MNTSRPGRAAFLLLASGLLTITPLVFYRGSSDQFLFPKVVFTKALVLTGAVAIVLDFIWSQRRWPQNFGLAAPLGLLVFAVLLSCLSGTVPAFSFSEAAYFLCGVVWVMILVLFDGIGIPRLFILVTIPAGAISLITLLQWTGHDPLVFGDYHVDFGMMRSVMRLYGTFGNPNFVAGYLIGAIFPACALIADARKHLLKIAAAVTTLLIFVPIIGTRSLGAWLGLAAGSIVMWLCARNRIAKKTHDLTPLALLVPLAFLPHSLMTSLEGRLFLWRASWPMFTQHPWLGSGWGTFQLRFPELQAQFLNNHPQYLRYWTYTSQLHNDPLQILLEAGALGFIAFAWVLWTFGSELRRKLIHADPANRIWLSASAGGVTALLVDSVFNFQLAIPPTLILLLTLLAVPELVKETAASTAAPKRKGKTEVMLRSVATVLVIGAAVYLGSLIVRGALADHLFALGLEEEQRADLAGAERYFRESLTLRPNDGPTHYGLARTLYLEQRYPEALASELLAQQTVADPHLEVLKARIEDESGDRVLALQNYRHALWLDPSLNTVRSDIERLSN